MVTQAAKSYLTVVTSPLSFRASFIGEESDCCRQRNSRFLARNIAFRNGKPSGISNWNSRGI